MIFVRMLSRRAGRLATFLTVVGLVVMIDQATKAAVSLHIPVNAAPEVLIPGVLGICHVENAGAAFSIGEGAGPLFIAVAVGVFAACVVWIVREVLPLSLVISIACVAGGGVGNMVDRLVSGTVTDFFATLFIDFPVFNFADIFVTLGVAATFVGYLVWDSRRGMASHEPVPDMRLTSESFDADSLGDAGRGV